MPHVVPSFSALPLLAFAGLVLPAGLHASGTRVGFQDAFATARGNAFVATADNPSAIYYNPAGVAGLEGAQILANVYAVSVGSDYQGAGGAASMDDDPVPVPAFFTTWKPEGARWAAGFGAYAPFGLQTEWPAGSSLRTLATRNEQSHRTYNFTFAGEVTDALSLGAGLTYNRVSTDLRRALGVFGPNDLFRFEGEGEAVGGNLGVLWKTGERHQFGLSYTHRTRVKLKGSSQTLPIIAGEAASATFDYPEVVIAGWSYRPTPAWNLEVNVDWTNWERLDTVTIHKASGATALPFDWEPGFFYEFGVTRYVGAFALSAGYCFTENSVPDRTYTPAVPDSDRSFYSLGVGYRGETVNVDLAWQYGDGGERRVRASAMSPLPALPSSAATRPTLLIVDDEEGPRQSLRMVFRHDFTVHAVDNGDQALAYAQAHPVDLAILDIRMAGKSGIDVLRGLKAADPRVQVIMLTAYETIETARQALRLGACDYLSKPFDLATIREAVARALELRRIAETMNSANEQLGALVRQLGDVTVKEEIARTTTEIYAGALHDIKNPLTVITGYVDLLCQKLEGVGSLDGDDLLNIRRDVEILAKQVNTCGAITQRYLGFAQKRIGITPEVGVNQVLDDVDILMRDHPSLREGRLCFRPLAHEAAAFIDATELIHILINLASNAFQAGAPGQEVWISAGWHEAPLDIAAFRESTEERCLNLESFNNTAPLVSFTVSDQGSGIPGDVLSRIFEPYFTTKKAEGNGLGLAIVSRSVKNHHGLLHVVTRQGEGTRFTVYFASRRPGDAPAA